MKTMDTHGQLPAEFESRIRSAHALGAAVLRAEREPDYATEAVDVSLAVERHRWAWRPEKPLLVLIAESHVFTSEDDLSIRMTNDELPADLPPAFVRLVYCLGYGENELLGRVPKIQNTGTWQYWDLFGMLTDRGKQPRKDRSSVRERIEWKIGTLLRLRQRGIWLLDSSLHAVFTPGGKRVKRRIARELHRIWWTEYGRAILEYYNPTQVWVIGKTILPILSKAGVPVEHDNWVYQPQAQLSNVQRERRYPRLLDLARNRAESHGSISS